MALWATGFLMKESYLGRTTLIDARNGFNKLSLLVMLWTVWHRWPVGESSTFNLYKQ